MPSSNHSPFSSPTRRNFQPSHVPPPAPTPLSEFEPVRTSPPRGARADPDSRIVMSGLTPPPIDRERKSETLTRLQTAGNGEKDRSPFMPTRRTRTNRGIGSTDSMVTSTSTFAGNIKMGATPGQTSPSSSSRIASFGGGTNERPTSPTSGKNRSLEEWASSVSNPSSARVIPLTTNNLANLYRERPPRDDQVENASTILSSAGLPNPSRLDQLSKPKTSQTDDVFVARELVSHSSVAQSSGRSVLNEASGVKRTHCSTKSLAKLHDRPPFTNPSEVFRVHSQSQSQSSDVFQPTFPNEQQSIKVRAKVTPAASPRRKKGLPGAEGADMPSSVSRPVSRAQVRGVFEVARGEENGSVCSLPPYEEVYNGHVWRERNAGKENVFVCVRVKYLGDASSDEAWSVDTNSATLGLRSAGPSAPYNFDAIVTGTSNRNLYEQAAKGLISSAMEGFDALIFAYGGTASGKTYSLTGARDNPGVIPQAVKDIFSYIRAHPQQEFLLRASYLEIYNETLKDLLAPETSGTVKIRQDDQKRFFVHPLREELVTSESQVASLLLRGETNRHVGTTDFNARSSRSHTLFQMTIESRRYSSQCQVDTASMVCQSQLSIIDLAGSEKATSQLERRAEGAFINKSLLTLEKVIGALTEDKPPSHVPYRDSKLTQILQPSLSGNARVSVVCTINPAARCVEDSKSTLKFAQRVKKVPVNAERNEIMDEKALIVKYQMHIAQLQMQLQKAQLDSKNSTPRLNQDDEERERKRQRDTEREKQVNELQGQIQNLQTLVLTSRNVDALKEAELTPRCVSPTKLNRNSDAEDKQLGATDRESISQLEDKLEEASDEATLLRDENSKLKDEIAKLKSELASRPPVPVSAEQGAKDAHIEELLRENEHLRTVVTNENVDQAVARERMRAKRECRKEHEHLEAKCVDLETRLEEQTEFSESLERQLIREAEASSSASFVDIGRLT